MAQKTAAGEYLAISINAAKAAAAAVADADKAAQAGDVPAAQAAAKRAAEESTIAEQAWEKLENYRKGIATEKTAKAKTNRDAAADNARLAKDFVKTARRIAKKNEKAESAVFDQMADAPEETPEVTAEAPALEGEILEPEHVDAPGMPPALDLSGIGIPEAPAEALESAPEGETVDGLAEVQKAAEAAELHAGSAQDALRDGDISRARVSVMLANGAAARAERLAADVPAEDAADARDYAEMAREYAEMVKGDAARAEAAKAPAFPPPAPETDAVLAAALAEIDAETPQAATEAPEAAEDVPEDAETVPDAQAAPESAEAAAALAWEDLSPEERARWEADAELQGGGYECAPGIDPVDVAEAKAEEWDRAARLVDAARDDLGMPPLPPLPEGFRPAGVHAERIGPRHTFRQLRPEPASKPVQTAADADAWEARAAEIAAAAVGEQGTLFADPADVVSRLAETAKDKGAAAVHWAKLGRLADAIVLAERAAEAARLATLTAAEHEPDAGALDALARPARAWAKAAAKAVDNAAG